MEVKEKYIIYARKSTESEERQVMSIDSQLKEMLDIAKRDGLNVVGIEKESYSAKEQGQRKVFNKILENIDKGEYNCILTWATDRLGRNAGDIGRLIGLMDQDKLLKIQTSNQVLTNNPNDKFMLMILGGTAKLENDNRSINIKRGMKARAEKGLATSIPTGYVSNPDRNDMVHMIPHKQEGDMVKEIFKLYSDGYSMRGIQNHFKEKNVFTQNGKVIAVGTLNRILTNPIYYGEIEFPIKSGNFIKGIHEPLISKELFQKAQDQRNKRDNYTRPQEKPKLTFTSLIRCAICGSQIVGYIQKKKQSDGSVRKHIYYRCCKYKNKYCSNIQTSEIKLLEQIKEMVEEIDLEKIVEIEEFKQDIKAVENYGAMMGDTKQLTEENIRNYIRHIIENGDDEKKRKIIKSFSDQFIYLNRKLVTH